VQVKVIGVDRKRRNVSLSMRAMQKDPLTETIESQEWRTTTEVRAPRRRRRRQGAGGPIPSRGSRSAWRQPGAAACGAADWRAPHPQPTPRPHPHPTSPPPPPRQVPAEIVKIVAVLMSTAGISDVRAGRQAEEKSTVAQDLELYLTRQDLPGGFTLVVRSGRVLQELVVETSLSRDDMKKALTRVLSRVR
jgi:hypothetical protein